MKLREMVEARAAEMPLIGVAEAASILGLSERRLRNLAQDGGIPSGKLAGAWMFQREALLDRPRKTCVNCGETYDLTLGFSAAKTTRDGRSSWCKKCHAASSQVAGKGNADRRVESIIHKSERKIRDDIEVCNRNEKAYREREARYCSNKECGAKLAYDNKSKKCGPCERKERVERDRKAGYTYMESVA